MSPAYMWYHQSRSLYIGNFHSSRPVYSIHIFISMYVPFGGNEKNNVKCTFRRLTKELGRNVLERKSSVSWVSCCIFRSVFYAELLVTLSQIGSHFPRQQLFFLNYSLLLSFATFCSLSWCFFTFSTYIMSFMVRHNWHSKVSQCLALRVSQNCYYFVKD